MKPFSRLKLLWCLTLAAAFAAAGCHSRQQQSSSSTSNASQQYTSDPSAANVAPVASGGTSASAPAGESEQEEQPAGAPAQEQEAETPSQDTADESQYGIQPQESAPQPPPTLPDYDQPPCPGDNYIWTPGYWSYAPAGYYWVPGAWVEAPFAGALWTPGYWVFANNSYEYFAGYWGPYVGFYGGIDYGFGYTGFGYHGGFWRNGAFNYDRSVNNIDVSVVHNYYEYPIGGNGTSRVSFNGGRDGVQARPRLAELAALREPHAPPMNTQIQLRQQAMANHDQFASVNRGRPAQAAFTRPVAAERGVRPTPQPVRNLPAAARPAPETARNVRPESQAPVQINRMGPPRTQEHQPEPVYPETNRPPQRYGQPMPSQAKPAEPTRPQANREEPSRPAAQPAHTEPARTAAQPARTEPRRTETARPQPQRAQPGHTEPQHPKPEERKPSAGQHNDRK